MQRRPQFVVLSVNTGSSVQQELHHLLIVVYATLYGERETEEKGGKESRRRTRLDLVQVLYEIFNSPVFSGFEFQCGIVGTAHRGRE